MFGVEIGAAHPPESRVRVRFPFVSESTIPPRFSPPNESNYTLFPRRVKPNLLVRLLLLLREVHDRLPPVFPGRDGVRLGVDLLYVVPGPSPSRLVRP